MYKCISPDSTLQSAADRVDFQLAWRRSFAYPLFAIEYLDLTNDGLKEITVASLSGLHVLQVSDFIRPVELPLIGQNDEKQTAPHENTAQQLLFEWSHFRNSFADTKV